MIETGKVRPSLRTLETIARRLGRPASEFLPGPATGYPVSVVDVVNPDLERLCQEHRYTEALQEAVSQVAREATTRLRAIAHLYAGRALVQLARPAEAAEHLGEARELFEAAGDPWGAAEAMDWEGSAAYLEDRVERALSLIEEALRRYRRLDPRRPDVEARMVEHLGSVHLKRGSPRDSLARYEEALEIAGTVHELSRLVRIYHGLATCQRLLGDQSRAIDLAQKAVSLAAVEHELSPAAARITLPRVENDLGMMLMAGGQFDHAERLFRSALSHFAEAGQEQMRSHLLLSIGELRQRQGRLDEALALVQEAIDLAVGRDETLAIAAGYQQLGELRAARDEHHLVDACFLAALAVLEVAGLDRGAAACRARHEAVRLGPDARPTVEQPAAS